MAWTSCGKFQVGFTEAELVRSDGQSVAGRIYYPAAPADKQQRSWLPWRRRRRGVPWLWDANYARGLGKFLFFRLPKSRLYRLMKQALVAVAWALGRSQRIDMAAGAELAPNAPAQLPIVLFSHGLGGNRFMYSIICAELASQGYVVLAVEHADGTACAVRQAGGEWKLYGGLGDEEAQVAKTRVRVAEMKAALQLMQALNKGGSHEGLKLDYGLDAASFLRGRLDLRCAAAVGHSYGGATITALVAEDPLLRCGVALDPWWYALYPEAKALSGFTTRTPLLIMGSHDWNTPNASGQLACGGERQEQVLAAAKARQEGGGSGGACGGGAMLLSITGSSHNTFADPLPLFGQTTGWLLERLGLSARLDPVLGIHLCNIALLHFLSLHLPLSEAQRAAQNWEPGKGHSGLDKIRERDAADRGETQGPLSWLFPGRGLVNTVSDTLINRMLPKRSTLRQVSAGGVPRGDKRAELGKQAQRGGSSEAPSDGGSEPSDVVTGVEAVEASLPSAEPASGRHPHAPSARTDAPPLTGATKPEGSTKGLTEERAVLLRAGVNQRYSGTVEAAEVDEMEALLGSEHLFKCIVV